VTADFATARHLDAAVLVATTDQGFTGGRAWTETPATLERDGARWRASAKLPAGATAWFFNVRSGELTVSSDFEVAR